MERQSGDMGEQWAHERDLSTQLRMTELLNQTAKALGVLNGGGAVAMLGLMQALVQKTPQFACFKPFGLWGLAFFVIGSLVAAATYFSRWYKAIFDFDDLERRAKFFDRLTFSLFGTAVATFCVGCLLAGIGLGKL